MAVADPVTSLENVMGQVMLLGALGGILIAVGVVLVIRGGGQGGPKTPSPQQSAATTAQPPGWYQNPYMPDSDSQMWWDGTKWTSNWR